MSEWKEFRLSEIMDITGGGTPKTSILEYWGGNIPWLSVVDFGDENKFVDKTEKNITELGLKNSSTKILKSGQIIISARGTVGELAMLKRDMAFNQSCYGLNAKEDICSNNFLYYLLKIKITELKSNAHGAVFDTITRSTFETISVLIPSLEKQSYIAEILSSLDNKIELNNKINQELETLAQTLFKQWFIDFEFPNENGEPYKSSGGEMVDSELGEIPNGWEVKKLSQTIKLIGGGTPKRSETQYWNGNMPWFSVQDVPNQSDVVVVDTKEKISIEGLNNSSAKLLTKGTTIITARGTVGKLAFVATPMAMNQSCYGVIGIESIGPIFNYLNLSKSVDELKRNTHGAVFDTITSSTFDSISTLLPNDYILETFENRLNPTFLNFENIAQENIHLKKLRDTLLPKLISGELEINEISN
jgi:type I restriction enzyme, S subunit